MVLMKVLQKSVNCGYGDLGDVEKDLYYTLIANNHECVIGYG